MQAGSVTGDIHFHRAPAPQEPRHVPRQPPADVHGFVNLRGYGPGDPVTAAQALQRFLRALGVAAGEVAQDVDDAAAMYGSLLADRRVLILLGCLERSARRLRYVRGHGPGRRSTPVDRTGRAMPRDAGPRRSTRRGPWPTS